MAKLKINPIEAATAIGAGIVGATLAGVIQKKIPTNKIEATATAAAVANPLKKFVPAGLLAAGAAGVMFIPNNHAKNACAGLAAMAGFMLISQLANSKSPSPLIPSLSGFDEVGEIGTAEYVPTYAVNGLGETFEGVNDQAFEGLGETFEGLGETFEGVEDGIEGVEDGIEGVEDVSGPTDIDVENGVAYIQGIGSIELP